MKGKRCPYLDDCFIIGSLQMLQVPHLMNYCYNNYENCRYFRSQVNARNESRQLREAGV